MALYLPQQHLALDIVDDPDSAPVDRDAFPGFTVVPVTCEEIACWSDAMPKRRGRSPRAKRRGVRGTAA